MTRTRRKRSIFLHLAFSAAARGAARCGPRRLKCMPSQLTGPYVPTTTLFRNLIRPKHC